MLRIRSHLDACSTCRQEYDATLRVKTLFGCLSIPEPPRPFDASMLSPRNAAGWTGLSARVLRTLDAEGDAASRPWRWLAPLRSWVEAHLSPRRLAWAGAWSVVVLSAALVGHPQKADAVAALVPETLSSEETAGPVELALYVPGPPPGFGVTPARFGPYYPMAGQPQAVPVSFTYGGSAAWQGR